MRRFVAIQILLALAPAVFSAPFFHLHRHEDTDHFLKQHQALVAHAHLSTCACPSGTAAIMAGSDDDSDAVFLNWFQDNPHSAPGLEFVPVRARIVLAPAPAGARIDIPNHRSHDPPALSPLRPRPPPE